MKSGYAQVTGFCKIPGPCYKEKQSLAGRNKQELLQETTEGTRTGEKRQHTNACQQHHTTQAANSTTRPPNGNPPTRALHMHQTRTPRTHHSTAQATKVAPADRENTAPTAGKAGTPLPTAHPTDTEAPGQAPGARKHAQTLQRRCAKAQRGAQVPGGRAAGKMCTIRAA